MFRIVFTLCIVLWFRIPDFRVAPAVCSEHFEKTDYRRSLAGQRRLLKSTAVPSLFVWTKKKEQEISRRILKIPPTFQLNTKGAYLSEFLSASVPINCCFKDASNLYYGCFCKCAHILLRSPRFLFTHILLCKSNSFRSWEDMMVYFWLDFSCKKDCEYFTSTHTFGLLAVTVAYTLPCPFYLFTWN